MLVADEDVCDVGVEVDREPDTEDRTGHREAVHPLVPEVQEAEHIYADESAHEEGEEACTWVTKE